MPQLDPTWFASQLFWLAVTFMVLYLLVSRFLLPPLMEVMEKRGATIESDIGRAEKSKTEAARAQQDYEKALAQSREMAQTLIAEVMAENKLHAEKTAKALDVEIAKKLADARARITTRKHELLTGLSPAAAEFAGMIAEKIINQPVSPDQASRVVVDLIKAKG